MNGFAEIIARVFNDPNKVKHIFHPKHNLERLGTPSEALKKITQAVFDVNQTLISNIYDARKSIRY